MPVEQGLPWHPVATGLAGQAIPFVVAAPPPPTRGCVRQRISRRLLFRGITCGPVQQGRYALEKGFRDIRINIRQQTAM